MRTNRNSKEYRQAMRQSFIPKGSNVSKITLKDGLAVVYLYSHNGAGCYAMAFRGSAGKPEFHHSYRSDAERRAHVAAFLKGVLDSQTRKATAKAEKAAWINPLKVGEILYTSWGYDQTNTEFYVVTRVSGKRVWIREIAADYEQTGFMSGKSWPRMPIAMVGEETMHIAQSAGSEGACVKIDHHYAYQEQGREHYTSSYA